MFIYSGISLCIFKQINEIIPIPVGVGISHNLYSPRFSSFPRALSFRAHYKKKLSDTFG